MPGLRPLDKVALAHLLNSSFAIATVLCPLVTLRVAGAGLEARTAAVVAILAVLTERTATGATTAGPVGILTFPPAPTVDQAEPITGAGAVGLLARSAYLLPPAEVMVGNAAAAVSALVSLVQSYERPTPKICF